MRSQFLRWAGITALALLGQTAGLVQASGYDLVIRGGRVIDPATGLDAIRDLGIVGKRIETVSEAPLSGAQSIDASGLVVSPGFIDLHAHGQNTISQTYQVRDGVTTALDLEVGAFPVDQALGSRKGTALIHYGYASGYGHIRILEKDGDPRRAFHEAADADAIQRMRERVSAGLEQGGIGIGLPLDYFSRGMSDEELAGLFRLAAEREVPLFVHIHMPDDIEDPSGFSDLIELTRETGASLHMVHITSTALQRTVAFLGMMDEARAGGLDITTEVYPYTAASTGITSGIFDHDWQRKMGITYGDIEWPPTGERFSGPQMWREYRERYPEGIIITHAMKEDWVRAALRHPGVLVASDGGLLESLDQRAHPRGMGTFARVLGHYVREEGVLTLNDALARMTVLPARRIEAVAPAMRRKGRLQPGMDADITIFDPDTVIDKATFKDPNQFSKGIEYVLVEGQLVVDGGELREGVYPGKAITSE